MTGTRGSGTQPYNAPQQQQQLLLQKQCPPQDADGAQVDDIANQLRRLMGSLMPDQRARLLQEFDA